MFYLSQVALSVYTRVTIHGLKTAPELNGQFGVIEDAGVTDRRAKVWKTSFLSAFPMFVPSLSWQNDRFYI